LAWLDLDLLLIPPAAERLRLDEEGLPLAELYHASLWDLAGSGAALPVAHGKAREFSDVGDAEIAHISLPV
jgi:hypothetical protein